MRKCTVCEETKDASLFKGSTNQCKACMSARTTAKRKTAEGLVKIIYANQKTLSRKRGLPTPTYSYLELCEWLDAQPIFHNLYHAWVASGHLTDLVPSMDRLDNTKGYSLNNIQVTTWRQNLLNQKTQNKTGQHVPTTSKPINMLSLGGVFLKHFPSVAIAIREVQGTNKSITNISSVCDGKWKTAYGYKWEWA